MEEKNKIIDRLKSGGITITKEQVQYKVSGADKTFVRAIIHQNGKITVKPSGSENFIFKNSDKELVSKVAKLILEATKIEENL